MFGITHEYTVKVKAAFQKNLARKMMTIYIQVHAFYNVDRLTLITHFLKMCLKNMEKF